MRVAAFPSDDSGCGWYRIRFAAQHLASLGHDIVIDPPLGYYRDPSGDEPTRLYLDADVAVVQRISTEVGAAFVQALKDHGHRVIIDVDDDLDALHRGHPYLAEVDGSQPGRHRRYLHDACQAADVVTVTTPALADRYGYGRAVVLPNLIPARYLTHRRVRSKRTAEPLLVGWTGRPISHIGDAGVMGGQVGPVVAAAGGRFAAWGESADRTFLEANVPPQARRRMPYRELRKGYPQQVAKLDVGLVPLVDSDFNRAKSWLKGIEYAALGVPFVASPTPEYRRLAELGAGELAETPQQWADAVGALCASERRRADLAAAGRDVAATLTYEAHSHLWWDAWTTDRVALPSLLVSAAA